MLKRIILSLFILLSVTFVAIAEQPQGQSCSNGNGTPTTITFINNEGEAIFYYWLSFDCQETPYGSILPGQSQTLNTYDGHEWIVRTASGAEVGRGVASSEIALVVETGASIDQLCSDPTKTQSATITLRNDSPEEVAIFWVNFECQEISYGTLLSNLSYDQPTGDGHVWVIRSLAGEELGRGVASSQTIITVSTSSIGVGVAIDMPESPLDFTYRPDKNWTWSVIEGHAGCEIRPTTPADGLDPFYQKVCYLRDVPIASSNNVPDEALYEAWNIMVNMTQGHQAVIDKFGEIGMMIGIVAQNEGITLLPQYAFLRNDPNTDWDARARGLGGNVFTPLGSGAEENLLCYDTDPYLGESIFLHEFAHTMKDGGIALIDPTFDIALNMAYQQAIDTGLWQNTYALETVEEYWAEGVQDYFNTNIEAIPTNGIHNNINTREELMAYDPTLFAIIDTVFAGFEWTPTCPE